MHSNGQVYDDDTSCWEEEIMTFDSDSFEFLEGFIKGNENVIGGKYTLVRDY